MRTVAHCRERGLKIVLGCNTCRRRAPLELATFCRAFDGWRVEELERAGALPCPCGAPAAVSIEAEILGGHTTQLEVWRGEYGSLRPIGFLGASG